MEIPVIALLLFSTLAKAQQWTPAPTPAPGAACPQGTYQCPSSLGSLFADICCANGQTCALDNNNNPACCPQGYVSLSHSSFFLLAPNPLTFPQRRLHRYSTKLPKPNKLGILCPKLLLLLSLRSRQLPQLSLLRCRRRSLPHKLRRLHRKPWRRRPGRYHCCSRRWRRDRCPAWWV